VSNVAHRDLEPSTLTPTATSRALAAALLNRLKVRASCALLNPGRMRRVAHTCPKATATRADVTRARRMQGAAAVRTSTRCHPVREPSKEVLSPCIGRHPEQDPSQSRRHTRPLTQTRMSDRIHSAPGSCIFPIRSSATLPEFSSATNRPTFSCPDPRPKPSNRIQHGQTSPELPGNLHRNDHRCRRHVRTLGSTVMYSPNRDFAESKIPRNDPASNVMRRWISASQPPQPVLGSQQLSA
jgi:hypothetical protein